MQGTVEGINKHCSSILLLSHNVYKSFVLDNVVDKVVDIVVVVVVLAIASLLNLSGGMSSNKSCGSSAGKELYTIIYNAYFSYHKYLICLKLFENN